MTEQILQMEEALNLAQCELRAMYNRLGIKGSNVLDKVDAAWTVAKKISSNPYVIGSASDDRCMYCNAEANLIESCCGECYRKHCR